ncbi:MAG: PIN domain-containing protein [Verrucomicrobiales bacterium]|nr:PIN domain-containing protein [Verrucomicrobiales bacterium]
MRELILDANVLVRFLVQDVPQQAKAARKLVEQAESGALLLVVDPMIIAETVYVLTSFYKKPREAVADALMAFVQSDGVSVAEESRLVDALRRFQRSSVDFADAWLAATAAETHREVASFDRDLDRFADVKRFEPTA